jgi:hypothetical protein
MFDQPRHAPGEHTRLARAGTSEHEQGSCAMFHGFPLRGVQPRQQVLTDIN